MYRLSFALFLSMAAASPAIAQSQDSILERVQSLRPLYMDEVIWLARCVYSESNLEHEQELVAWVVRNRVETGYRGTTYREVILEPLQFSAFNRPSDRRSYILGLDQYSEAAPWKRALRVAYRVMMASDTARPFALETRHFYSPVSMPSDRAPAWAESGIALSSVALDVDPNRFRFFSHVDEGLAAEISPALVSASDRIEAFGSARGRLDDFRSGVDGSEEDGSGDGSEEEAAEEAPVIAPASNWTPRLRFSGKIARPRRPAATSGSRR